MDDVGAEMGGLSSLSVYVAERISPFYQRLAARVASLTGSEYIAPSIKSGETRMIAGTAVTHQDLGATSYDDCAFEIVVHADVLEHVADYKQVLAEMHRILRPGGVNLFTVPFRHHRPDHLVKATLKSGVIVHHAPPEIHGNPLHPGGALVFQLYGWKLLDELKEAGFYSAEIGVLPEPGWGFTSSNSPHEDYIEPVVFLARKER
jgi:SAM-dependent methyltransferase